MDFGSAYSLANAQAQINNAWNAEQAQINRDFQERLSSSAHQREVADLKAAGLNPVLSANGSGASTPSGSTATADSSIVSIIPQLLNSTTESAESLGKVAGSLAGSIDKLSDDSKKDLFDITGADPNGKTRYDIAVKAANALINFLGLSDDLSDAYDWYSSGNAARDIKNNSLNRILNNYGISFQEFMARYHGDVKAMEHDMAASRSNVWSAKVKNFFDSIFSKPKIAEVNHHGSF